MAKCETTSFIDSINDGHKNKSQPKTSNKLVFSSSSSSFAVQSEQNRYSFVHTPTNHVVCLFVYFILARHRKSKGKSLHVKFGWWFFFFFFVGRLYMCVTRRYTIQSTCKFKCGTFLLCARILKRKDWKRRCYPSVSVCFYQLIMLHRNQCTKEMLDSDFKLEKSEMSNLVWPPAHQCIDMPLGKRLKNR